MFRIAATILLLLFGVYHWMDSIHDPHQVCRVLTQDSIDIDIWYYPDSLNSRSCYRAEVFTPICQTSDCYDVRLILYWDLLGRYIAFDTLTGHPLTKQEHEPFTAEDYARLDEILAMPSPRFAQLKKEEVVVQVDSKEIDGFTGATLLEIKEEVIPGAAYSCYTLWHVSHGVIQDSILQVTSSLLDSHLMQQLFDFQDLDANYYIIDHFKTEHLSHFNQALQKILQEEGPFFTREAVDNLPLAVLMDSNMQSFFAQNLRSFGYFVQTKLIGKLDNEMLTKELIHAYINLLTPGSSSLNHTIIGHLHKHINQYSKQTLRLFHSAVKEHKIMLKSDLIETIQARLADEP